MKSIGTISSEGGPLIVADLDNARLWPGLEVLPAGLDDGLGEGELREVLCDGRPYLLWDIGGSGTADVFQDTHAVLLVRAWLEMNPAEDSLAREAEMISDFAQCREASVPQTSIATLEVPSSRIAVWWAWESGDILAEGKQGEGFTQQATNAVVVPVRATRVGFSPRGESTADGDFISLEIVSL